MARKKKEGGEDLKFGLPETTDAVILDESDGVVGNRDISDIEATELDGITINRTKSKISPFVHIRRERLVDQLTGAPSRNFGIWVPDPEAKEGWRDMGVVSESYMLVNNDEARMLALDMATESGLPYTESRIFWDGARFAHIIDFTETTESIDEDETIGLSLITRNSYDRSWKFESALMGKRFACDNGMLAGEFFARVAFKHVARDSEEKEDWKDVVRQGLSVISHASENLERFVKGLRLLRKQSLTDEHLRRFWKTVPGFGATQMGKIMSRYLGEEEPTLYGLLNAGTHVFWHNERMTGADFSNNDVFVSRPLQYAFENLN